LTAATGMDALTQLIEPFLSCRANPLTDALCRQAIPLVARSIEPAMQDGDNLAARTELALGSMFSGMALANAGLGAVHGLAGPIGGWCGAAHGAICAALLPAVTRVNHEEAVDRNQTTTLERFRVLGRLLGGEADSEDPAASALDWLAQLQRRLSLPGLQALGVARADFAKLAAQSLQSSSMKGNPVKLSEEKLIEILQAAY
ncbi:MAG TPA: alcohol dehydrogenase, partial [Verrucomicrobiales bacterium]|nr:alcohol dehydrogenase [Verrucomicrobiales bacterium]